MVSPKDGRQPRATKPAGCAKPAGRAKPTKRAKSAKPTEPAGPAKRAKSAKSTEPAGPAKRAESAKSAKRAKSAKPADPLGPIVGIVSRENLSVLRKHLDGIDRQQRIDAHGNRKLFLKDIFLVQLLAFFQPIARSLRTVEDLSTLPAARQMLDVDRVCRSTLSDANKIVEPTLLEPLMRDLIARAPLGQIDGDARELIDRVVAVDGSFLSFVGEITWALSQRTDDGKRTSKPRIDAQLHAASGVPKFVALSGRDRSECAAAKLSIEPGAIYAADKAYFGFDLLGAWLGAGADFVVAINSQIRFAPSDPDAQVQTAGEPGAILADRVGRLPGCGKSRPPDRELRELIVVGADGEPLRLLTSLTDPSIDADMIIELYRQRWQIELFFRWLKCCANFRHLISHSKNGLTVALYVAIVATVLQAAATGTQPSKRAYLLLSYVASGQAELADITAALHRAERENRLARERRARRRASAGG